MQLLSIRLYKEMMESVVENGKKPLKFFVNQSLLPLFFHCHDGNQKVAEVGTPVSCVPVGGGSAVTLHPWAPASSWPCPGCGATSGSVLPCRPLGKRCFLL